MRPELRQFGQKVEFSMESTRVIILRQARRRARATEPRDSGLADSLVTATVDVALQVANGRVPSTGIISAGAMQLANDALRALAESRWRLGHTTPSPSPVN